MIDVFWIRIKLLFAFFLAARLNEMKKEEEEKCKQTNFDFHPWLLFIHFSILLSFFQERTKKNEILR